MGRTISVHHPKLSCRAELGAGSWDGAAEDTASRAVANMGGSRECFTRRRSDGHIWGGIWIAYMQNRVETETLLDDSWPNRWFPPRLDEAQADRPGALKKRNKASSQYAQFANRRLTLTVNSPVHIHSYSSLFLGVLPAASHNPDSEPSNRHR